MATLAASRPSQLMTICSITGSLSTLKSQVEIKRLECGATHEPGLDLSTL